MMRLERDKQTTRVVGTERFGDLTLRVREEGLYMREKGRRNWLGPMGWPDLFIHLAAHTAGKRKPKRASRKRMKVGV